ncbi:hypothetical protein NP233_g2054 [Leucocoprinus birnbaumii]|uniref:Amino acid permease/ SLC12A domain-containing protein n=1 Tax=Leucocoprinus birnbaumii TaxID=56174 RepID=A0AAD5VZN8_9AGAR|nr:hypothetical protein NP233_g2054 [Leucocoprinus birnbaumii]
MPEDISSSTPPYRDDSLEKNEAKKIEATSEDDYRYYFDAHDLDRVQRRLKQRHIQMIAIAGTIGTGLFLGSGGALATAGPLGALIAYILVGTVVYATLCSLSEMTCWAPISGTFPHFAGRWVDPALGFAVGWNYFYSTVIGVPTEISAATVLLVFWDLNTKHAAIYIAAMWVVVLAINLVGTRWFGEAEFCFAIIKLSLIIALLLSGLVIDLGGGPNHDRIGFRYWKHPGALNRASLVNNVNTDRFLAWVNVLVQASFSFLGVEMVAISQSCFRDSESASQYCKGCILMIGMLVAYDDDSLLQTTGTAAQSPFVIAINRAGVKVFPHVINACIFSSAFSSGNTLLFASSRILYGLALRGQAPKVFTRCTKTGLPLPAVLGSVSSAVQLYVDRLKLTIVDNQSCIAPLAFMTVSKGGETVFNWLVGLSTTSVFLGWFAINLTFIRFRSGMLAQGIDPKSNVYHNRLQPWTACWGMFWTGLFTLVNGYGVFLNWDTSKFLISYPDINIPIFIGLYLLYKIPRRSKFWKASEMDFYTGVPSFEETETHAEPKPSTLLGRVIDTVF